MQAEAPENPSSTTSVAALTVSAVTEFLVLPYASSDGGSLVERLTRELSRDNWDRFWGAVAFANRTGNDIHLLDALSQFIEKGGTVSLTFGADVFGAASYGTELEAVRSLLTAIGTHERAKVFLYHERGRTFHPKMYIFSSEVQALVIIGSSNWTRGGLAENVEANVAVHLDLTNDQHRLAFNELAALFQEYWTESQ